MGSSSQNERSEAQLIYDSACEELTVLLHSTGELWNKPQTIPSGKSTYRLRFAHLPAQGRATWDPSYFDFFRTPKQVHEKIAHQEARITDWGGVLVGVYKPPDPRKYFLPRVGVACPVTAILDCDHREGLPRERVTLLFSYMIRRGKARSSWQVHSVRWQPISPLRLIIIPTPGCCSGCRR